MLKSGKSYNETFREAKKLTVENELIEDVLRAESKE